MTLSRGFCLFLQFLGCACAPLYTRQLRPPWGGRAKPNVSKDLDATSNERKESKRVGKKQKDHVRYFGPNSQRCNVGTIRAWPIIEPSVWLSVKS